MDGLTSGDLLTKKMSQSIRNTAVEPDCSDSVSKAGLYVAKKLVFNSVVNGPDL